jgi:hypothetical protein
MRSRSPVLLEPRLKYEGIASVGRDDDKVTLIYDKGSVDSLNRDRKSNWTAAFILSHEIGHVALGHLESTLR